MLVYSLDELKKFCTDTVGDEDATVVGVYIAGSACEMVFVDKEEAFRSVGFALRATKLEIDVNRVAGSNYIIIRSINYVK